MSETEVGSGVDPLVWRCLGGRFRRDSSASLSVLGVDSSLGVGATADCLLVEVGRLHGGNTVGCCLDAIDVAVCHTRGE
jgi:hypothetical protein